MLLKSKACPSRQTLFFCALFIFANNCSRKSFFFLSYVTFVFDGLLYEKIEILGSRTQIITLWLEGRNSMKKRLMTAAAAVCGAVIMAMPVLAANAGWQRDNRGWWYRYADGGYAKSAWVSDNGNWYHMDENGYMQTGWVNVNGDWYYLDASGSMQTGEVEVGGNRFMLSDQHDGRYGRMLRNGEVYEGQAISAWTEGSGHPKGALKEDGRRNNVIQESRGDLDADDTIKALQEQDLENAKREWASPEFQQYFKAYHAND